MGGEVGRRTVLRENLSGSDGTAEGARPIIPITSERDVLVLAWRGGLLPCLLVGPAVLLLVLPVDPVEGLAAEFPHDEEVVPAEGTRRLPLALPVLVGPGQRDGIPRPLRVVMVLPKGRSEPANTNFMRRPGPLLFGSCCRLAAILLRHGNSLAFQNRAGAIPHAPAQVIIVHGRSFGCAGRTTPPRASPVPRTWLAPPGSRAGI